MSRQKKKILLLGGAYSQIPIIMRAKEMGLHVIICDYFLDNPGQEFADEFFNVSTTNKSDVLELAKSLSVDFVLSYASDPAAPVAAYVSEKLGLPGNSFKSVETLANKDLFRQLLSEHGFNSPRYCVFAEHSLETVSGLDLEFPLIVKPTDSSGSKGVSKVNNHLELTPALTYALSFSKSKTAIVEEFIDADEGDLHGDGFVINGELGFLHVGDHLYNGEKSVNPFNPTGTVWPSCVSPEKLEELKKVVFDVIKASGFKVGPVNIEARYNHQGKLYIMEIGPRNGGHFVPQAIWYSSGIDLVEATLNAILGRKTNFRNQKEGFSAYYALSSEKEGVLKEIIIDDLLEQYIMEKHIYFREGQRVKEFSGSNAALGVIVLKFDNSEQQQRIMKNIKDLIEIKIG